MATHTSNRKRSSRACECCRSRKVRCDMQTFGSPCTNCLLNEAVCHPASNVRKLRSKFVREVPDNDKDRSLTPSRESLPKPNTHGRSDCRPEPKEALSPVRSDEYASSKILSFLPPFVDPPRLPKDDLEYLRRKQVLDIPEFGLMTELLTSYCNWVHPQLPVIDLQSFLDAIFENKAKKVSLLLLQTVLFAGAAFVEESVLIVHGYDSKIEAQDQFFQRAKLLYQTECEDDSLVLAQAALLLSINHRCSKSSMIWLAQSHNVAEKLGLQHLISYVSMNSITANACKRLWWCIFVRDCILNLELGTPKLFRNRPEDTPSLTMECFEKGGFSDSVESALSYASIVHCTEFRTDTAWAAVKRAQLASLLCPIQALTTINTTVLAPRSQAALTYLDRGLQSWLKDFEYNANANAESLASKYQQGLLLINYLATRITLLQRCPNVCITVANNKPSQPELGQLIRKAITIARHLYSTGLTFCATSGMSTVYNIVNLAINGIVKTKLDQSSLSVLEDIALCLHGLQETAPRGSVIEFALRTLRDRLDRITPQDIESQHGSIESESLADSSIHTPPDVEDRSEVPEPLSMQESCTLQGFEEYFEMLIDQDACGKGQI